jgi:hypothetical protein
MIRGDVASASVSLTAREMVIRLRCCACGARGAATRSRMLPCHFRVHTPQSSGKSAFQVTNSFCLIVCMQICCKMYGNKKSPGRCKIHNPKPICSPLTNHLLPDKRTNTHEKCELPAIFGRMQKKLQKSHPTPANRTKFSFDHTQRTWTSKQTIKERKTVV